MAKLEFDDDIFLQMEKFNNSAGAVARRSRILSALKVASGAHVLDVGCGPGHQVYEIAQVVGSNGCVEGVDSSRGSTDIASRRCSGLNNVKFSVGDAYDLPYKRARFNSVMSSQVFEYLDDVPKALDEIYRVLKPSGRVLIHGTAWGALLWHSKDPNRMRRILEVWDRHLADPNLPEQMSTRLCESGFVNIEIEPIVHIETSYNANSMSGVLMRFIEDYVVSQGVQTAEANAWAEELQSLETSSDYFFSSNEYIFTGTKP